MKFIHDKVHITEIEHFRFHPNLPKDSEYMLSHDLVTIDGVWIGEWIY
jgi:hypothetical protein